jgi:four helix bundle protein
MAKGLENLEIYQLAERLEIYIFRITKIFPRNAYREIRQLRNSSSAVSDNIAEGYGRYTFKDKIHRMHIARGEAEESKRGIIRAHKKGFLPEKNADFISNKYTELIKLINGYIRFLRKNLHE